MGWIHNLGEGGACLEAADRLPPGTRLHLRLQADGRAIELEARVVWTGSLIPRGSVISHGMAFVSAASHWPPALGALLLSEEKVRGAGLRLPLELPVTCRQEGGASALLRGRTGDVSRGGFSLFLPQPLSPGTALKLTLHAPGGPIATEGTIVWVAPPAKRASGEPIGHGLRILPAEGSVSAPLERLLSGPP